MPFMENSMTNNKLNSYVGLAQRAGAVLYGEDIILEKLRFAKVVLINGSATEKFKDRVMSKITVCPVFVVDDLQEMLHRDRVNAIAVSNESLANQIIALLR